MVLFCLHNANTTFVSRVMKLLCFTDHIQFRLKSYGGSLFYLHLKDEQTYTMSEAEAACSKWFNGHLTSIHSQEEYNYIM